MADTASDANAPRPDDPSTAGTTPSPEQSSASERGEFLVPPSRLSGRRGPGSSFAGQSGPASHMPASLRHIDWTDAFPFVHLFKGFRVAAHPPKLILALLAVLLIYGGGRLLDAIWNFFPDRWQAVPNEVARYEEYQASRDDPTRGVIGGFDQYREMLLRTRTEQFERRREAIAREGGVEAATVDNDDLLKFYRERRDERIATAERDLEAARERREGESADDRRRAVERAETLYRSEVRSAYAEAAAAERELESFGGTGLFLEFYNFEVAQVDAAVQSLLSLNLLGSGSVVDSLYRFVWVGPVWGLTQHTLYFALLFLWSLIVLAILGGALARIAAVQVARDEKISLRSALRFSSGKFVSFLSAPLIPMLVIGLIVAAIALVVLVLSLLGKVPYLGWLADLGVGIFFFLALLGGFIMALTFVGLVGGISLMYPTIAAEGTDSFDAISRSFSYLFARPWRLAFYAVIALAYGAITFLFVRLFLWLVLICTHGSISLALLRDAAGTRLLDALWPSPPTPGQLSYDIPYINLTPAQDVAATLIAIWVYLVLATLAAYALSLFLSLGTIIYFLMRRTVDATELDEVYIDPVDEEYGAYADVPEDPTAEPKEAAESARMDGDDGEPRSAETAPTGQ